MRAQFVARHWLTGVLIVVVIAVIGFIGFYLIPSESPKTIGDAATTAVETEVSDVADTVVETAQTGVDAPISTSPSEIVAHEAGANGDSTPWIVLALVRHGTGDRHFCRSDVLPLPLAADSARQSPHVGA